MAVPQAAPEASSLLIRVELAWESPVRPVLENITSRSCVLGILGAFQQPQAQTRVQAWSYHSRSLFLPLIWLLQAPALHHYGGLGASCVVIVGTDGEAAEVEPEPPHIMRMKSSTAKANNTETPAITPRLLLPSFTYAFPRTNASSFTERCTPPPCCSSSPMPSTIKNILLRSTELMNLMVST